MTTLHLSEEELQKIVNNEPVSDPETLSHLKSCNTCQHNLALTQLIVSQISVQPIPQFDVNVKAIVMEELRRAPVKRSFNTAPMIIAAFIAVPLYLFRKNVSLLASGISGLFLVLSLIIFCIVVFFNTYKLYHHYQTQLKKLDIPES